MAVAIVQKKSNRNVGNTTSVAVVMDSNVTAGNMLVVFGLSNAETVLAGDWSDTRSGVYTDVPGSAFTAAGFDSRGRFFVVPITSSGPCTVTLTIGLTNRFLAVVVWEVSGHNASTPVNASVGTTGTSATPTTGNLVTNVNTLILGVMIHDTGSSNEALGVGANYTQDEENEGSSTGYPYNGCHRTTVPVAAGTYTVNWTIANSQGWGVSAVAIAEAGGSATAAVSGTATEGIDETDVVAGGKTIVLTLTGATFIP